MTRTLPTTIAAPETKPNEKGIDHEMLDLYADYLIINIPRSKLRGIFIIK